MVNALAISIAPSGNDLRRWYRLCTRADQEPQLLTAARGALVEVGSPMGQGAANAKLGSDDRSPIDLDDDGRGCEGGKGASLHGKTHF